MNQITPSQSMEAAGSAPVDEAVCPCNGGNRFWLENSSGQSLSTTFSAGGTASPVLPQTSMTDTRSVNTLEGSGGPLQMTINGRSTTVLENVDTSLMAAPEDLRAGLVVGARRSAPPAPLESTTRGIAFTPEHETVGIGDFLPSGVSEGNTDIDLVCVMQTVPGSGQMAPGTYPIDGLNDDQALWFLRSVMASFLVNSADAARTTLADIQQAFRVNNITQLRGIIRELVFEARFTVKPISSWGGQMAIIFKGRHTGRAFLTAIMYGTRNAKMGYVSSYAQIAGALRNGGQGAGNAIADVARGTGRGNIIGFFVAAVIEVHDFFIDEDPEKNWGDLLGRLGVSFAVVWAAGFVGTLAAGAFAAAAAGAAPVILVVAVGVVAAVAVGFLLDKALEALGVSDGAARIGREFANVVNRAIVATGAFVDRIIQSSVSWLERQIDAWNASVQNVIEDARRNDPVGYCALFCSNPLDQAMSWRALFR